MGEQTWTKGTVQLSIKLSSMVITGKFILADIEDDCILGLDLMRKYGLTIDLKHHLLKGPHGDMPLYELGGKDCLLQTKIEEVLTRTFL